MSIRWAIAGLRPVREKIAARRPIFVPSCTQGTETGWPSSVTKTGVQSLKSSEPRIVTPDPPNASETDAPRPPLCTLRLVKPSGESSRYDQPLGHQGQSGSGQSLKYTGGEDQASSGDVSSMTVTLIACQRYSRDRQDSVSRDVRERGERSGRRRGRETETSASARDGSEEYSSPQSN